MTKTQNVIYCGSFSKSIAPALRVGYVVAPWQIMSQMLALKTDAGSGAVEQMMLAEYCGPNLNAHIPALRKALQPTFPQIAQIQLVDYKVRILNGNRGTGAITRVLIDWHDGNERRWSTVGAGTNILDATWLALADGYEFALSGAAQPAEKKEALA